MWLFGSKGLQGVVPLAGLLNLISCSKQLPANFSCTLAGNWGTGGIRKKFVCAPVSVAQSNGHVVCSLYVSLCFVIFLCEIVSWYFRISDSCLLLSTV